MAGKTNKKTNVKKEEHPPLISRAEKALAAVRNNIDKHQDSLQVARENLRNRRRNAAKKGTQALNILVDKAQTRVEANVIKLDKFGRDLVEIKARVKTEAKLKNIKDFEQRTMEKLVLYEKSLMKNAEEEFDLALDKFKSRWHKKRVLLDKRKLKASVRKNKNKLKEFEKRIAAEIRALQRKSSKALSKPAMIPKSPGRPRKASEPEVSSTKPKTKTQKSAVKAKSTTSKSAKTTSSKKKTQAVIPAAKKRGGTPGKDKSNSKTVASKTAKAAVKSKAAVKKKAAVKSKATVKKKPVVKK